MFSATKFSYDGVESDEYGLQIASLDNDNVETTPVLSPTLGTAKGKRSKKFYHTGITYDEAPSYRFSIISEDGIPKDKRGEIIRWLAGRNVFKKLYIHQDEYADKYFNCVFTDIDFIYIGGILHGFTLTAVFDSNYCYGKPIVIDVECAEGQTLEEIVIENKSDIMDDYVYPTITFDSEFEIENKSDGSRVTRYELPENSGEINEKITIDGESMIISGEIPGDKLSNFNLNWLRLKSGVNTLKVTALKGDLKMTITCPQYALLGF